MKNVNLMSKKLVLSFMVLNNATHISSSDDFYIFLKILNLPYNTDEDQVFQEK